MATMKAVVKTKSEPGAELLDVPIPTPGPDQVLVKVLATSICGTDLHIFQWNEWAQKRIKRIPQIMGHELCGQVVETGSNVTHIKKDSIISAETHIACGYCYLCRNGLAHICENVKIFGVDVDGVFAEYAVVPAANAWMIEDKIPNDYVSVMEPLGNAIHTVLAGDIAGNTVLITGCGPIGLMSVAVCKICGATKIIATEINEYRLQMAKKMGADIILNPKKNKIFDSIMQNTNGKGVDVVLEMSGNQTAITDGLKSLR
ncbi:MAG: alcohol dehydrogenase catalytic domain-containing protein, partial [candidate division WOR-3 bacterium]